MTDAPKGIVIHKDSDEELGFVDSMMVENGMICVLLNMLNGEPLWVIVGPAATAEFFADAQLLHAADVVYVDDGSAHVLEN